MMLRSIWVWASRKASWGNVAGRGSGRSVGRRVSELVKHLKRWKLQAREAPGRVARDLAHQGVGSDDWTALAPLAPAVRPPTLRRRERLLYDQSSRFARGASHGPTEHTRGPTRTRVTRGRRRLAHDASGKHLYTLACRCGPMRICTYTCTPGTSDNPLRNSPRNEFSLPDAS